ncbi:ankyrin repeat-containing domain protein, partial [Tirmania nivea]
AQILLDSGANYDIQDEHGATPLHIAVEYDRNEIAKLLLDKGASCDIRDDEGNTPLRKAWKRRHLKLNWGLIKLLLEKGATCGVSELVFEFRGVAPLHIAAQNGKLEIVRLLLERGANPNVRDCQNYTPLQRALELNDPDGTDIAKLLLQMEKGGNDSIRGPGFDGVTALHTAAKNGKLEIANLLLGEGVDCDLSDRHGATPLRRALECQSADGMEIAKLLLERGARYDPDNAPDGATFALLRAVACSKGNTNVALMQMLLEKEVNYTFQDRDRRTLLHFAAGAGSEGVVELLLEKDPEFNVDCRCHAGKTPLHEAAKNGEANIVQMLLTKRANPNIKDALGRTPLHASLMGYERI